jgi:hypothetical protein
MTSQYDEVAQEVGALIDKGDPAKLSKLEKAKLDFWGLTAATVKVEQIRLAQEEAERRAASTSIKDRFLRSVDVGYLLPNPRDKKVVAAAQEMALRLYDEALEKAQKQIEAENALKPLQAKPKRAKAAVKPAASAEPAAAERPMVSPVATEKDIPVLTTVNVSKRNRTPRP